MNIFARQHDFLARMNKREGQDALLNKPSTGSASVAVGLIQEYYLEGDEISPLPRGQTLTALVAATREENRKNSMKGFYWSRLAKAYIEIFPEDQLDLLKPMLTSKTLTRYNGSEAIKIANDIVKSEPSGAWAMISSLLEDKELDRYEILFWLGDTFGRAGNENPPVNFLPPESVIAWTKEEPEHRLGRVMRMLPKTLDPATGGLLTSRFVEEFGGEKDVAGSLIGHFWTGSWSGPESLKLEKDRDKARKWLSDSTSQPVRSWLLTFIASLTKNIREAKIREEREF